jgi:hypothetical protein
MDRQRIALVGRDRALVDKGHSGAGADLARALHRLPRTQVICAPGASATTRFCAALDRSVTAPLPANVTGPK